MNKAQRERCAELLRCAADIAATERWGLIGCSDTASAWLRASPVTCVNASLIACAVAGNTDGGDDADEYIANMLEAAQRVEEGWTP